MSERPESPGPRYGVNTDLHGAGGWGHFPGALFTSGVGTVTASQGGEAAAAGPKPAPPASPSSPGGSRSEAWSPAAGCKGWEGSSPLTAVVPRQAGLKRRWPGPSEQSCPSLGRPNATCAT